MAAQYRFLIDECLSPTLARLANAQGFDAAHVTNRSLTSCSDRRLAAFCLDHDLVMVTNNAVDFQRIYSDLPLHPGLIIIVPSLPRPIQEAMFGLVLKHLSGERDLVNRLLKIDAAGVIAIAEWPAPDRDLA